MKQFDLLILSWKLKRKTRFSRRQKTFILYRVTHYVQSLDTILLTSKLCYEFRNLPHFRQLDMENEPAGQVLMITGRKKLVRFQWRNQGGGKWAIAHFI